MLVTEFSLLAKRTALFWTSDTSDDDHLGVCGAVIVGEDDFGLQRCIDMEVGCADSEDGNDDDWEDTDLHTRR